MPDRPGRPKHIVTVSCERLAEDPVGRSLTPTPGRALRPHLVGNLEPEWAMFQAAVQSCGHITGASCSGSPQTCLWTPEVKGAIRLKKRLWQPGSSEKWCLVHSVNGGDGEPLTSTEDVVRWWKGYLEELLNEHVQYSRQEAELQVLSSHITGAEVTEAVKRPHRVNTPGG